MQTGLTHIYCGDGKGKTTAAVGLVTRAAGDGKKVLFVQFLKGRPSGEVTVFESLSLVTVIRAQELKKFAWDMTDEERAAVRKENDELLAQVRAMVEGESYDLLVLDEALGACQGGLLSEERLLAFVKAKPASLELVLTGRNPSEELSAEADYISEVKKVKHPFDEGINARKGIEY